MVNGERESALKLFVWPQITADNGSNQSKELFGYKHNIQAFDFSGSIYSYPQLYVAENGVKTF